MATLSLASFIADAKAELGVPYVWGGASPSGFDCSGLVQYALEKAGWTNVPRTSSAQEAWATPVSYADLQPGDLIFSEWPGDTGPAPGHVAIYLGAGQLIEAPETGEDVHIIPLDASYEAHVTSYGRPPGGSGTSDASLTSSDSGGGLVPQWLQDLNPVTGFLGGSIISGFAGTAGSIGDVGTAIASMATEFGTVIAWLKYLFSPSLWLRVGAFWFGLILLTGGVVMLVKSA